MNNEFWFQLHTTALAIVELNNAEQVKVATLLGHLDKIDIVYDRVFDPVDHYPEYVATMLCKALGKALLELNDSNIGGPSNDVL